MDQRTQRLRLRALRVFKQENGVELVLRKKKTATRLLWTLKLRLQQQPIGNKANLDNKDVVIPFTITRSSLRSLQRKSAQDQYFLAEEAEASDHLIINSQEDISKDDDVDLADGQDKDGDDDDYDYEDFDIDKELEDLEMVQDYIID